MKIGFDVDGVLADFASAYQRRYVELTGMDKFLPGDAEDAPCWDWDILRGYTAVQQNAVWEDIKTDANFWQRLHPLPGVFQLGQVIHDLEYRHEVYFITSRPGTNVKRQSETWLNHFLAYPMRAGGIQPTAIIVGGHQKGKVCAALGLDVYIDDNYDNARECAVDSPATRTYLLDRRYNQGELSPLVIRVQNLKAMLDHELTNL